MNNSIKKLREAWENLPEGLEDCIILYNDGNEVAYVYKSKRGFDEVFDFEDECLENDTNSTGVTYFWRPIAEVVIMFDSWEVESSYD